MDGPEWASTSAAARELVSGLLEKDPHKRYTIDQALAHPWVAGGATDAPISRSIVKSMQNFNRRNKFKKNALKLIARCAPAVRAWEPATPFNACPPTPCVRVKLNAASTSTLSAVEVQKLRQTFHEIDSDHTGTISFVEMAEACKRLNIQVDIDKLIQSMDEDGDGVINYDEFITATADRQLVHHQNNIWWAFCEYDTNGVR